MIPTHNPLLRPRRTLLRTRIRRRRAESPLRTPSRRTPRHRAGLLIRHLSRHRSNDLMPLRRVGRRVRLERELMRHGHFTAEGALAGVLAFDVEFRAVDGADEAVGEVERLLRRRVLGEVVVGFEFVEVL